MSFSLDNATYGTIILPSPRFGNSQSLDLNVASNMNRSDEPLGARPAGRPENVLLDYEFLLNELCDLDKADLDLWLQNTAGEAISIVDHNGLGYQGFITASEIEAVESASELWTFNLSFVGSDLVIRPLLLMDGTCLCLEDDTCLLLGFSA